MAAAELERAAVVVVERLMLPQDRALRAGLHVAQAAVQGVADDAAVPVSVRVVDEQLPVRDDGRQQALLTAARDVTVDVEDDVAVPSALPANDLAALLDDVQRRAGHAPGSEDLDGRVEVADEAACARQRRPRPGRRPRAWQRRPLGPSGASGSQGSGWSGRRFPLLGEVANESRVGLPERPRLRVGGGGLGIGRPFQLLLGRTDELLLARSVADPLRPGPQPLAGAPRCARPAPRRLRNAAGRGARASVRRSSRASAPRPRGRRRAAGRRARSGSRAR